MEIEEISNFFSEGWAAGFRERVLGVYNLKKISDLGSMIPLKYQTVYSYLSGKATPSMEFLLLVSREAGVSIHWLLTGEGEKYLSSAIPERVRKLTDKLVDAGESQIQQMEPILAMVESEAERRAGERFLAERDIIAVPVIEIDMAAADARAAAAQKRDPSRSRCG